jgi:hypothetical protein
VKLLASNTTKVTEKPLLNLPELSGISHINPHLERVLVVGNMERDYLPCWVATIWLLFRRTLVRSITLFGRYTPKVVLVVYDSFFTLIACYKSFRLQVFVPI